LKLGLKVPLRTGMNPVGFMGEECDKNAKIDVVTILSTSATVQIDN